MRFVTPVDSVVDAVLVSGVFLSKVFLDHLGSLVLLGTANIVLKDVVTWPWVFLVCGIANWSFQIAVFVRPFLVDNV